MYWDIRHTALLVIGLAALALGLAPGCEGTRTNVGDTHRTTLVHLCRDEHEFNRHEVAQLYYDGWRLDGPLYNDGINCTVTLWSCGHAQGNQCKDRSDEERAKLAAEALRAATQPSAKD